MKCPMTHRRKVQGKFSFRECIEKECAWWYKIQTIEGGKQGETGECAILKIAKNTGKIGTK